MGNERSLQDILGNSWREHFSKEETIKDLLKTLDLKGRIFKNIVTRYSINDDRLAIISTIENTDTSHLEKMIIDVKTGVPTGSR